MQIIKKLTANVDGIDLTFAIISDERGRYSTMWCHTDNVHKTLAQAATKAIRRPYSYETHNGTYYKYALKPMSFLAADKHIKHMHNLAVSGQIKFVKKVL
jgi:hypothetical protein